VHSEQQHHEHYTGEGCLCLASDLTPALQCTWNAMLWMVSSEQSRLTEVHANYINPSSARPP
jgi:hypothetical protein